MAYAVSTGLLGSIVEDAHPTQIGKLTAMAWGNLISINAVV